LTSATTLRVVASDGRGSRPPSPGRRHDENRRDAPPRGPSGPRPSPGGPRCKRSLIRDVRGPGESPGRWRDPVPTAVSRPDRTPGEQALDRKNQDPVATGGDGVLSC